MARGRQHVDPVIGVARVDDRGLVLLQPLVHLVPVEGEVAGERRRIVERLWVAPDRVLGDLAAGMHGPVRRLALVRAGGVLVARDEQVHADLLLREVVDRQKTLLVQQLRVTAVDDGLAAEPRADPPRRVLEVDQALRARQLEVERAGRAVPERAGSDGEGHAVFVAAGWRALVFARGWRAGPQSKRPRSSRLRCRPRRCARRSRRPPPSGRTRSRCGRPATASRSPGREYAERVPRIAAGLARLGRRARRHGRADAHQPAGVQPRRHRRAAPRRDRLLGLQHLHAGAGRVPVRQRRQPRGDHRAGVPARGPGGAAALARARAHRARRR